MSENNNELVELYRKHRPALFKEVLGQDEAVATLSDMLKRKTIPHAILFTGPSGCGKTTLARILKVKLDCGDRDFAEINCAEEGGLDMVRSIKARMGLAPLEGKTRIWLFDECQSLSRVGFAQQALLKILEDAPTHVYFFLCTTDPSKLIKTIHTRCTEIKLRSLTEGDLCVLLTSIAGKEGVKLTERELDSIVEIADGSARKALVILHQVIGLDSEEKRLEAIRKSDSQRQGIELARLLLKNNTKWSEIASILKGLEDEPETLRRLVLGYMSSVILGGGPIASRAFEVLQLFRDHYYDSGRAGLIGSCWESCHQK